MARIKLIVTGDMEKAALHESLQRVFPPQRLCENGKDHEEVVWDKPRKLECATSQRLLHDGKLSTMMLALAQAMLAEAGIGKRGTPADLVVIVDDVELNNLGQETMIIDHFRRAMTAKLDKYEKATQERYRLLLREKCSFHLLRPMVESYLFGDPQALGVAGVPAGVTPLHVFSDVEQFETNDPDWLPTCHAENEKKKVKEPWWRHERHPKHYLELLTTRGPVFYEETKHGKRALQGLDWAHVPKLPAETPVIRSLFEDLAYWFGVTSPLGIGPSDPRFYPLKTVDRASLLLRNL